MPSEFKTKLHLVGAREIPYSKPAIEAALKKYRELAAAPIEKGFRDLQETKIEAEFFTLPAVKEWSAVAIHLPGNRSLYLWVNNEDDDEPEVSKVLSGPNAQANAAHEAIAFIIGEHVNRSLETDRDALQERLGYKAGEEFWDRALGNELVGKKMGWPIE